MARLLFVGNQPQKKLVNRDGVEFVQTSDDFSAVDEWILNEVKMGDLVLTADLELAKQALIKGASLFSFRAKALNINNIDEALAVKQALQSAREIDDPQQRPVRGSRNQGNIDKSAFKGSFHNFLSQLLKPKKADSSC